MAFSNKLNKFTRQLHEIDEVKGLSLSEGCVPLDALVDGVSSDRDNPQKSLYPCRLKTHYIAPDSDIVPDPHFESGVVKIQEKRFNALTDFQKATVECLKVPTADIDGGVHNEEPSNLQ
jgi:hypothetical protein